MTVAQVLDSGETLPVLLRFARPECMDFFVDRKPVHASFFGEMFLSKVYDEPYLHCLDINGCELVCMCGVGGEGGWEARIGGGC